jgi:PPK2 family polyphosphate:nucleotide phosphotransferase
MSGVNPHSVEVHYFKRPSEGELDHNCLWPTMLKLPPRGRIGIFNRSYYEEVLVCKVHPEIVQKYQRLPDEEKEDMGDLFDARYKNIAAFEADAHRNGIRVVKIMLNVSKDEQKERFIERIEDPAKNWKFNAGDVAERGHWDAYMDAYEDAIRATATPDSPWYVVPADDKKNTRLIISAALIHELQRMKLAWPVLPAEQKAELDAIKEKLNAEA